MSDEAVGAEARARALRVVIGVLVVAALAAGAYLLWPTAVPDDLDTSDEALAAQEVVVRVVAEPGRCWTATLPGDDRDGCGTEEFGVELSGVSRVGVRRAEPGEWPIALHLEVARRQVGFVGGEGWIRHEVLSPADSFFPTEAVEEAESYEQFLNALWILSQWALIATFVLYARRGAAFARESSAGPIGTGMLLGMLGLGIAWLVGLPFGLAAFWWAKRYEQTEYNYLDWLLEDWALLGSAFFWISFALLVVMGLARWLGEWWWLPGAAVFVAIAGLFSFTAPYLDFTTEKLDDPALLAAAREYERELGVAEVPIRVEEVSEDTELANAYAYGMGPTRTVVLWDTILLPPFEEEEQKIVLAHELAHHSQEHLPKGLGWFAIFAVPGAWILMRATRSRGGMGVPEAVPVALIVTVVFQLATAPLSNHVSRRMEAEADWKALEVTEAPAALEGVMNGFVETSLSDPHPPRWAQLFTGTHPTLEDRVAMARAWAAREGR